MKRKDFNIPSKDGVHRLHVVLNELDKDQVYQDVLSWLDSKLEVKIS